MALTPGRPSRRTAEHVAELKAKLADDEEVKRLNVLMPQSQLKRLKQFALDKDMTMSDVVKAALEEYMSK